MVCWVQRFPGRLEYELADFERRGLDSFSVDQSELSRGRVALDGSMSVDGAETPLRVIYPDLFPYFRPEVYAPDLQLRRHQNPYDHNLCLLEAPSRAWGVSETAAWLVAERVPFLMDLLKRGGDSLRANEVPQGEPDSYYVAREHGTAVFLPEEALQLPPDVISGQAYFSFSPDRVGPAIHVLLRQLNAHRKAGGGVPIAAADAALTRRFNGPTIEGRWVRLESSPGRDPQAYFALAEDVQRGYGQPPWQRLGDAEISILGVVFGEEIQQEVIGDSWLFAVRYRQTRPTPQYGAYVTKGERFADEDAFARIPRLRGLASRSVALLGLGSLGAPLAFELARAQIRELRVLDYDTVDAGNLVRWPVGVPAVGSAKTAVVEATIASHYPRTTCRGVSAHLGFAPIGVKEGALNDFDLVEELLDGVDLVVDATGELAIQQLVSDLARRRQMTQVYAWGTEGAYGGAVARCVPGSTGCWFCLQLAIADGTIEAPPHEETGTTQPRGCGLPTFTGEAFNLLPIIAQACRVVTSTLLGQQGRADVSVMSLHDPTDPSAAPRWHSLPLARHPECPHCGTIAL